MDFIVEIPSSSVDRIIRKGGGKRVAKSAIIFMQRELEEYGVAIAQLAVEIAEYAGKKTIDEEDIRLALRKRKLE